MKLFKLLPLILLNLTLVFAQGTPDEILVQAREAIANYDFSKANTLYKSAMKAVKDAGGEEEEYNKVVAEWKKLEAVNVMMADGRRELDRGNKDTAISKYNKAYEKMLSYSNDIWLHGQAEAKYSIGMVYTRKGNTLEAAKYFVEARSIYPDEHKYDKALANIRNSHYNEGNKAYRIKDYETAQEQFLLAIEVDPQFSKAYNALAKIAKRDGDIATAESYYKSAVNFSPDYYKAWYGLGLLYHDQGNNKNSIKALKECIRIKPSYYKAHYILGKVYESEKQLSLAKKYLKSALKINKNYAKANALLASIYNEEKNYAATVKLLSSLKGKGASYKTYYFLAQAYNAQKQYTKALTAVNASLAKKKNWAPALIEKGDALAGLKRHKEAVAVFKLAGKKDARYKATADYRINELTKWVDK